MIELIKWFNSNSGFSMFLLTFVYVIATVLICVFNYRSSKATKDQIKESRKQFVEQSRAHIVPKMITLEGAMVCLSIHNIGKDIASDVIINISEEWLKKLDETTDGIYTADKLRKLKSTPLFLTVDQQIVYDLCCPGNGNNDFKTLGEIDFEAEISYNSFGNNYVEKFKIPFSGYSYLLDTSDYVRLTNKKIGKLRELKSELANIRKSIDNLGK